MYLYLQYELDLIFLSADRRMLVHKLGNNFAGNVEALAIAPLCVCVCVCLLMIANVSAFLVIMLEECSKIYTMWVFFAF